MNHILRILSVAAALGAAIACSSGSGSGSSACPSSPPSVGTSCLLSNGTQCSYATPAGGYCGGGGGTVIICQNGTWTYGPQPGAGGAGGYVACPVTAPAQGSSCTPSTCGGGQQTCTYDCAHCGGYNCTATCNGSTWNVLTNETACEVGDAAIPEAGDAGKDAVTPDGSPDSDTDASGD